MTFMGIQDSNARWEPTQMDTAGFTGYAGAAVNITSVSQEARGAEVLQPEPDAVQTV